MADGYDALVSKRVYMAALAQEVTANIIFKGSGTQFDPDVVEGFNRIQLEFKRISSEYST